MAGCNDGHHRQSEPLAHALSCNEDRGDWGFRRVAQSVSKSSRILAADDQQHILEAIELLLKAQGYEVDDGSLSRARRTRCEFFDDAVLIDLNYTRDTTSGQEGMGSAFRYRGDGQHTPGDCDDGMGQCGPGG